MAKMDDFELDEATLKVIEEEAAAAVEADFELDDEMLKAIEKEALKEAGLDESDVGDDFLAEIKEGAAKGGDLDLDDFDLDDLDLDLDFDLEAKAKKPEHKKKKSGVSVRVDKEAPEPATATQKAKRAAYDKAKSSALSKKKRSAVAKARNVARVKLSARPRSKASLAQSAAVQQIEQELSQKQSQLAIVGVIGGIVFLLAVIGVFAIIVLNQEPTTTAPAGPTIHYREGGRDAGAPDKKLSKNQLAVKMFNEINRNMRSIRKGKGASKEKIEEELARLRQLRQKYPEYAQSRETALQKAETTLARWLEIYRDEGPSGIEDEPAGFDEIY